MYGWRHASGLLLDHRHGEYGWLDRVVSALRLLLWSLCQSTGRRCGLYDHRLRHDWDEIRYQYVLRCYWDLNWSVRRRSDLSAHLAGSAGVLRGYAALLNSVYLGDVFCVEKGEEEYPGDEDGGLRLMDRVP